MEIRLACGKNGASIQLPDGLDATVLEPRFARDLDDPEQAIRAALDSPAAGASLSELARGKKTAAISVCDITRPAPNKLVLPPILDALARGGIEAADVRIVIATGLHREATAEELDEILGPDIVSRCQVDSHRARNLEEQAHLGRTAGGTEVYVDRAFIEADLHLSVGFIEPHLMAGFSGGRKLISIGLAGERTIKRLHSPLFMRDPKAGEGSFPDNPLHRELLEIAAMARHDFMVDVALTPTRGIAAVFAGEPEAAHRQGVEFVRASTLAAVDEPADLVVTTSGGYPLDLTFYQAIKGVTAASHVVKPGGTILLVAECSEGLGGPEFADLVRRSPDSDRLLADLAAAPVRVDQWQAEKLAIVARSVELAFCLPRLDRADRAHLWGPCFDTPQEALETLAASLESDAKTVVIPKGPYVFSQVERQPEMAV